MTIVYEYPKNAYFGKTIPKSKFYDHANITNKIKNLFVEQVENINWLYKLAPETLNIKSSTEVPEIQIIQITLRSDILSDDVLRSIDTSIKYPVIFELNKQDKMQVVAALKIKNTNNSVEWSIGNYFKSNWMDVGCKRSPMEFALNLGSIYTQILVSLCPIKARQNESLVGLFERCEQLDKLENDSKRIKRNLSLEKQFNKKVLLNSRLRDLENQMALLLD